MLVTEVDGSNKCPWLENVKHLGSYGFIWSGKEMHVPEMAANKNSNNEWNFICVVNSV